MTTTPTYTRTKMKNSHWRIDLVGSVNGSRIEQMSIFTSDAEPVPNVDYMFDSARVLIEAGNISVSFIREFEVIDISHD